MKKICHSKPTIGKEEYFAIKKVLNCRFLTQDGEVEKFENELAKYFGLKYAVCTSSGTTALHLALLSLNIKTNDEIIIPSFVCTSVLNAVLYLGAKPVIVDVSESDGNITYEEIKKNITYKTKAIIVPHMFGFPVKKICEILKFNIPVIEDCAQSIGAKIASTKIGTFGKITIMSFYGTKMLTTGGEGGAVLTNSKKIFDLVRDLKKYDKTNKFEIRYNYKITELQAVIGIEQLKKLDMFILKRKKIAQIYTNELKNCNIILPKEENKIEPVYFRYIIKIPKYCNIEKVIYKYKKFGIEVAKPVFLPLDKYYYKKFINKNSTKLYFTSLSLPIYPSLTDAEIKKVIKVTKNIFG